MIICTSQIVILNPQSGSTTIFGKGYPALWIVKLYCKTRKILCLHIFDDLHYSNGNVLFLKFSFCKNAQILHFGKTKNFEFFQFT